jgi:hypothetical protein
MVPRFVFLIAFLACGCAFAQQAERPACTSKLSGAFWPEEANRDPRLAIRLSREGTLEICSRGSWRFRWSLVSINAKRYLERDKAASRNDTRAAASVSARSAQTETHN